VDYQELMNLFQQQYAAKNYKGALKYIREATKKDSRQLPAWLMIGNLYLLDLNQPDAAINALRYAFKVFPKEPKLLLIQTESLLKLQKFEEAMVTAGSVLESEPNNALAWDFLDKISIANKKLLPKINQLRSNLFQTNVNRARDLINQNKINDAIVAYEQAIQINPSDNSIAIELARLYHRIKNFPASQTYTKQALVKDPNNVELKTILAYNYLGLNELQDAYLLFKQLVPQNPTNTTLKQDYQALCEKLAYESIHKGDSEFMAKNFDAAKRNYNEVLKYLPGSPEILQRIDRVDKAILDEEKQQKLAEQNDFITYLSEEAKINEELEYEDILRQMPPHSEVKDKDSLRNLLKKFISSNLIKAMLTPDSIKFTQTPSAQMTGQNRINPKSFQSSSMSIALRNQNLPVIVLREGILDNQIYRFKISILNNSKSYIYQIITFVYFPQPALKILTPNPQFIPQLAINDSKFHEFQFEIGSQILDGKIQAVVLYLDADGELNVHRVSGLDIENISGSLQPMQYDPTSFATMLQTSQKYSKEQDSFVLQQNPQNAFQNIQDDLKSMHFHVQKAVQGDGSESGTAFIYATAKSPTSNDPVLLDIQLTPEGPNSTKVAIKSSANSSSVSKIMARSVKSSIMMPKCNLCGTVFPIALYDKIKKGQQVICEICGNPARFSPS
jgi:tetratricopeptide (TPR) repeat protein